MTRARLLYCALLLLATPVAMLYLLWRARRQPEYRQHWGERFGWRRPAAMRGPLLWVHAVSLGETRAAEPLVAALLARWPQHRLLLTHMTPTGRAAGAALAARHPGRIEQRYLPYDYPWAMRAFLRAARPAVGLVMETEVWPNLLAVAQAERVPMVLVNARLSERSLAKARRTPKLMQEAARRFTAVLAQSAADAERLRAAGAAAPLVVGNLKFDHTPDDTQVRHGRAWRAQADGPVWLAASTREGEEALLLDATAANPAAAALKARWLVVPRHPQRFGEVATLLTARGLTWRRRSALSQTDGVPLWPSGIDVILGDTMGEMALYVAAADIALVGGSLAPLGGQNLIEACAVGTPVVLGPHMFNFEQATADALAAGAAVQVDGADAAVAALVALTRDAARCQAMSTAATAFAQQHRGATARTLEAIGPLVVQAGGRRGAAPL